MKKLIIFNLIFILCLFFIFPTPSIATTRYEDIKEYFKQEDPSKLQLDEVTGGVYSALKTVGIILAVCIMVTMAIQWFVATPNKRAQLKERLVYYFAGVILLLAGVSFLNMYEHFANNVGTILSGGTVSSAGSGYTNMNGEYVYYNDVANEISKLSKTTNSELENMSYDKVKDYVNKLNGCINQYEDELENGNIPHTSGSDEQLSRAKSKYNQAYDILVEKYKNEN